MATPVTHTAIHEAGHAVAHHRFKIDQEKASIVPKDGNQGSVTSACEDHVWDKKEAEDMTVAYLAGYAALRAWGYSEDDALQGAEDDLEKAQHLINIWDLESRESLMRESVKILSKPENRLAVKMVAAVLLEKHTIFFDEIDEIVERADEINSTNRAQ